MHVNIGRTSCIPTFALLLTLSHAAIAMASDNTTSYFTIQVVDRQTGRGVPLVELKTTNNIRLYTDSNGIVAFNEPGLMDLEVFFHVASHGYEYPKDGFGYRGVRLVTTPGETATVKIDRINIAERLYRVTGQGIYRDSILVGHPVPLKNPALNGQVIGQDSVFTCRYRGRIFWMWGDTGRPGYPLGNFAMSGATSELPARGGLDPAVGVDLKYFVDEKGFSREMAPLKEGGLVWLDGLMTVRDPKGNERMVAKFARLAGLSEVLERGLMVYNDETETFEPLRRPGLEFLPYRNTGHAFKVEVAGQPYYYFTSPSPMGARLRVRANWNDVIDANQYEVLTALTTDRPAGNEARWVKFGDLLTATGKTKAEAVGALEAEAKGVRVYDVESGDVVTPHNGTVYYNPYRKRWIGIFVQHFGGPSVLGELWYAEADTPTGPWIYARKIVTHDKYSFYNPKHHVLFDRDGGRTIYFEGTYSHTFSDSPEHATPRYDYNQIMYRLSLNDPRLALPSPLYRVRTGDGSSLYMLGDTIEQRKVWDRVGSVICCAMSPDRTDEDLIPIYAQGDSLTTQKPSDSATPVFLAWPADETQTTSPLLTDLDEYRHAESGQRRYATKFEAVEKGWKRTAKSLCRVWQVPNAPVLIDPEGKPPVR